MPSVFQRASTASLTTFTPNTVSTGSAVWKSMRDLSSVPACCRRSATMKVIFSGAPAHFGGPAGRVISAWPPFCLKASSAAQVATAAWGPAYTLASPLRPIAAKSMPSICA